MREEQERRLRLLQTNQEYLQFLAQHKDEAFQINFILEAAGYGNLDDHFEETKETDGLEKRVKKFVKTIFKKVG